MAIRPNANVFKPSYIVERYTQGPLSFLLIGRPEREALYYLSIIRVSGFQFIYNLNNRLKTKLRRATSSIITFFILVLFQPHRSAMCKIRIDCYCMSTLFFMLVYILYVCDPILLSLSPREPNDNKL